MNRPQQTYPDVPIGYPNRFARMMFLVLEDTLGPNGFNTILRQTHMAHYIDNYPGKDLNKTFDFRDIMALQQTLEDLYGPRSGRGLMRRAGRITFQYTLKTFGAMAGIGNISFRVLPLATQLKLGMGALSNILNQRTDLQTRVYPDEAHTIFVIEQCPGAKPGEQASVCFLMIGIVEEGARWVSGMKDISVRRLRDTGSDVALVIQHAPKEKIRHQ